MPVPQVGTKSVSQMLECLLRFGAGCLVANSVFFSILCRPKYSDSYLFMRIQLFSIPCLKIIITGAVLFFLLSWSNLGGLERAVLSKQCCGSKYIGFGSGSRSRNFGPIWIRIQIQGYKSILKENIQNKLRDK